MKIRWLFFDPQGLWSRLMEISHSGKMMAPKPYHVAPQFLTSVSICSNRINQKPTEHFRPKIDFLLKVMKPKSFMATITTNIKSDIKKSGS